MKPRETESKPRKSPRAFTLIELLVVISIIGLLAALTVGLSGVAGRKNKEARVRAELDRLVTLIENYKARQGFYPPDNPGRPSTNQLFYELTGTVFKNNTFTIPSRPQGMSTAQIEQVFRTDGFANSARNERDIKFSTEFKSSQFREMTVAGLDVELLAAPVRGPAQVANQPWLGNVPGKTGPINPWCYVSASPTNNPRAFDLWADVLIGKDVVRFSNWNRQGVTVGSHP